MSSELWPAATALATPVRPEHGALPSALDGNAPNTRIMHTVLIIIGLYVAAAFALDPFARIAGPEIPGLVSMMVAGVVIAELSTSFLLFTWFREAGTWSLLLLASAYLFTALMAAFHLLSFPGTLLPGRIALGSPASVAWTFQLWINGFAILTMAAILLEQFGRNHRIAARHLPHAIAAVVCTTVLLGAVTGCLAIKAAEMLPALLRSSSWTAANITATSLAAVLLGAGVVIILTTRVRRDPLFLWLAVANASLLFSNVISLLGGARYTLGWSVGRATWLVSALVLFVFFLGQFVTQQRRLAAANGTLERRVTERTDDLLKTVMQRDGLLREVYHRVSNNLQVVDSLIAMESRRIAVPLVQERMAALRNRVFTLGLAHRQLMASQDLKTFALPPFVQELADAASGWMAAPHTGVRTTVLVEPAMVGLDFAVPFGLLLTEIMAIAIHHGHARNLIIDCQNPTGQDVLLTVSHDGDAASFHTADTRVITGLNRQLEGHLQLPAPDRPRIELRLPLHTQPEGPAP